MAEHIIVIAAVGVAAAWFVVKLVAGVRKRRKGGTGKGCGGCPGSPGGPSCGCTGLAVFVALLAAGTAPATDTVDRHPAGAIDVELHSGSGCSGRPAVERESAAQA